jgi:hypothetical protein
MVTISMPKGTGTHLFLERLIFVEVYRLTVSEVVIALYGVQDETVKDLDRMFCIIHAL